MIGAIIGDIVGSRFEWDNIKTKEFEFFVYKCKATDDSIMSLAVAQALLDCKKDYSNLSAVTVKAMQEVGRPYPNCGYGGMFCQWMYSDDPQPYNSFGNGAAMRVSPCGFAAKTLDEAKLLSRKVTEVTHSHPEGIKGAEATTVCIYLAREGKNISEIRDYVNEHYYPMNFTLDGIRDSYKFNETCQNTVPQAIMAFLESTSFEDAIRNAISIGGDSDTLATITGGIAEAYYGIPADLRNHALTFLDERLLKILNDFESIYPPAFERNAGGAERERSRISNQKTNNPGGYASARIIGFHHRFLSYQRNSPNSAEGDITKAPNFKNRAIIGVEKHGDHRAYESLHRAVRSFIFERYRRSDILHRRELIHPGHGFHGSVQIGHLFERAELRHLRDKLTILHRIERILIGELR